MNLIDLEAKLRTMENQISQILAEVEKAKSETEETKIDYDAIMRVAKKYPINELDICHAPEQLRKEFVSMLMYLFVADDNGLAERLLYLTRLAVGCKLEMNAKDVYQSALTIKMDDVERLSGELADYRYSFVIEVFVVANLSVGMDKNAWTLLADIVQLMKCDEEEIVVLSHVAKYKLTGDTRHLDEIPLPKTNRWSGKLREYIPREWVESKRYVKEQLLVWLSVPISSDRAYEGICKITDSLKSGTIVKEKDVILRYEKAYEGGRKASSFGFFGKDTSFKYNCIIHPMWKTMTMTAPCDGIVYFSEIKRLVKDCYVGKVYETYLEIYVVPLFDDYDSFKSWMDNR